MHLVIDWSAVVRADELLFLLWLVVWLIGFVAGFVRWLASQQRPKP